MGIRRLCWFLLAAARLYAQAACDTPLASPVLTVALPGHPFSVAATRNDCWLFVSLPQTGGSGGGIAVLSRKDGRVELAHTVPLSSHPTGIVLTHDGQLLIAAAGSQVVFLNVSILTTGLGDPVVGSFSTGERKQSIYANVTSNDRLLFVSEESAAEITVIDLQRARRQGFDANSIVGKIPVGRAPIALTFSRDERWLFTTSQVALKEWNWPAACRPENRPEVLEAINPEGAVLVVDVAKAATDPAHAVAGRVPAGCSPVRMARSPSADRVYVTARNSNAVLAFDTAKLISDPQHARLGMARVGAAPVPVAVVDGGRKLVVGNSNRFGGGTAAQSLTLLDASKIRGDADAAIGSMTAGAFPREMRVSSAGRTLYLTNFGSDSLQAMDVARLPRK